MDKQLILLGAPGCGKGTQADILVENMGFNHVSTGALLREELAAETELGKKIAGIMAAGALVDDQIVLELLQKNCDPANSSYIFDGFPRNIEQAKALDEKVLKGANSLAIYLEIGNPQAVVDRIVNRRSCEKCGAIFNLISSPPKNEGECDRCSAALTQRKDDTKEVVENRLKVYETAIAPVLDYYNEKGILKTVNASRDVEVVSEEIKSLL